jgi:GNAT superfamily N-acetyltransferase
MADITIRGARLEDAAALARIHADVARYYVGPAADYFQLSDLEGASEELGESAGEPILRLVAETDGEVVAALVARLVDSDEEADGETGLQTSNNAPLVRTARLLIEYLATAPDSRRRGVGTLLVEAAETWGRDAGASIAETSAYHGSALSVPFWEERMGYEERSVNLQKDL